MVKSIKSKIIVGVLCLILIIQIGSSWMHFSQVKSLLLLEFSIGTQNLLQPLLVELHEKVKPLLELEVEDISRDELIADFDSYVQIMQTDKFESILLVKKDLTAIGFVNPKGEMVVRSQKISAADEKGKEIVKHHNNNLGRVLKIADHLIPVVSQESSAVVEFNNEIFVVFPIEFDNRLMGRMILTMNNNRIVEAKKNNIITASLFILIYLLVSLPLVLFFTNRVISKPVNRIINLMKNLAVGKFDQHFTIKTRDEIGELGEAVNNLVDNLQTALNEIDDTMEGVEQGNLSQLISAELQGDLDKLKNRINQSISMLSETISTVLESSEAVETNSRELSDTADALSTGTSKQAASLEEISSSMAEIENHSRQNMQNSNEAKEISGETLDLVNKGSRQMEEMQASMNQINNTSMDVTKIIKVIDEIAFQTNLLALNAAVEAARAGKYGKGFAVVAEEVRNLASRSTEAAKNTTDLIESSLTDVGKGVENANKTAAILSEIITDVEKSNELAAKIAVASQEQSTGISEMNTGIQQINSIVQQNSAISQQTASASDILLNQSRHLKQEINKFQLLQKAYTPLALPGKSGQ